MSNYVRIFDTTLRDGEQTPGVTLTPEQKLEIAVQLDRLGVDVIEAGFPAASMGEMEAVKRVSEAGLRAEICALARAVKEDIDAAMKCDPGSIHVFFSTSDVHLRSVLKISYEEALRRIEEAIDYTKAHGFICEFSPMDATRTNLDFLKRVCVLAEETGADRINIPDTVGIMTPRSMHELISEIRGVVNVPISVHCHNDFGLAVANTLSGIEAGAVQAHVTMNGIGERAGNAALEEVVLALHLLFGKKTKIDASKIYATSQIVRRLTGVPIQPHKPIVGDNAFAHESGIHVRGVVMDPASFEPFKPELVGRVRKIVAGKHAGRHGIKTILEESGLTPTEQQLEKIVERVKELGDKGKAVTDTDVVAIARSIMETPPSEKKILDLKELAVMTGTGVIPTSSVRLSVRGKDYVASETGVGPVDASLKAIQRIIQNLARVNLKEFRIEAVTGGSDAVAEVIVKVEDEGGRMVSARGAREDIVMASVEAMINALNKLLSERAT
ncbi:MAG: 2-isopropylmalate synthase [Aigarchaeota archaeon]|nr:2-isopropylmalate synthase [Aigarchaeota archaeon]MDW8021413.1 2-isopropylmalate synthase [Nitrososphaerota archaeon]